MKRLIALALLCAAWKLRGADTLTFTPSPSAGVTNYSVYYGPSPSRTSTNRIHIGTNTSWLITGVPAGSVSFLYATAWTNGIESLPSNEILYTNKNFAPTIQLNMILERSLDPSGPYEPTTNTLTYIAAVESNAFYRVRLVTK